MTGIGWSNLTRQAILELGFRFDWAGIALAWRALGYPIDEGDVDLTLCGPGPGFQRQKAFPRYPGRPRLSSNEDSPDPWLAERL
jgi:hypothetical protein